MSPTRSDPKARTLRRGDGSPIRIRAGASTRRQGAGSPGTGSRGRRHYQSTRDGAAEALPATSELGRVSPRGAGAIVPMPRPLDRGRAVDRRSLFRTRGRPQPWIDRDTTYDVELGRRGSLAPPEAACPRLRRCVLRSGPRIRGRPNSNRYQSRPDQRCRRARPGDPGRTNASLRFATSPTRSGNVVVASCPGRSTGRDGSAPHMGASIHDGRSDRVAARPPLVSWCSDSITRGAAQRSLSARSRALMIGFSR